MMKRLMLAAALLAATVEPERTAVAGEIDNLLGACVVSKNPEICQGSLQTLPDDWKAAMKGSYDGQRNIAFCLSTGCDGAMVLDEVQGCAWRIVILGSDAAIDQTDVMNYRTYCEHQLTRRQQSDARLMASRLFRKIYKRKLDWRPD